MQSSLDVLNLSAEYVTRYGLALVRVLGALSLNPLLGTARVPLQARIGLGLFVTMVLFPPGAPGGAPASFGPGELAGELLVGLLAGFAVSIVFAAVQFAASLLNLNMGFGLAGSLDPTFDLGGAGLERFFSAFALLIFVQINGHHLFLAGLHQLFQVVDVGAFSFAPSTMDRLAALSGGLFSAAIKMSLPILAALMLADLGLAILSRIAPQFNLFSLGLPVKMAAGLAVLAISVPVLFPRIAALFRALPSSMTGLFG